MLTFTAHPTTAYECYYEYTVFLAWLCFGTLHMKGSEPEWPNPQMLS